MRKVILFMMTSLDGFFEDSEGQIDWHNVDAEFGEFANDQLDSVDVLLFGRLTYELMSNYWPTPGAIANDPITAEKMNAKSKIVFSTTLKRADWVNTRLIRTDIAGEISTLRQQPGKDMIILGSSGLAVSFLKLGLLDEVRVLVNPIVLGDGKPLFRRMDGRLNLKLLKTRQFRSGNVLLQYQPRDL